MAGVGAAPADDAIEADTTQRPTAAATIAAALRGTVCARIVVQRMLQRADERQPADERLWTATVVDCAGDRVAPRYELDPYPDAGAVIRIAAISTPPPRQ